MCLVSTKRKRGTIIADNRRKKTKKNSKIHAIANIFIWTVISTVLLIVAMLSLPKLFGYSPYIILSGSMEPVYGTGSMVYVESVEPESVEVDDVISFVFDEDLTVVTHRVVEIDEENSRFTTKGDANDTIDGGTVHFNNLLGVVAFGVPYLGYIYSYFTSTPGIYIAIVGFIWLIVGAILLEVQKEDGEAMNKSKRRRHRGPRRRRTSSKYSKKRYHRGPRKRGKKRNEVRNQRRSATKRLIY